ncbi:hypothetical protein BBJ29_006996 [Phytophthora kernoviae]|uniref:Cleavage/polyadenylation specificity factor A subunit C-terminal domain-containing protein n=1 Tax=Phytophthora kernoviae TaxID=325452 RepID=A0A3F2RN27_9STRA|nr:hypothetical protein BBJ29_006996 [Phytophthora kernoviae]RLN60893.1 hypothetical protein BBP00_00005701 [Phytophthora kernoviae]
MGQHFLFHRDLVAATAVHHALHARLTNDVQADLVLLGPQWLRIYRLEPSQSAESSGEVNKGQVLHLQASFPLAGVADSAHVLRFDRNLLRKKHRFYGGEDVLLLTFPLFKWVIVGYDRRSRTLATLAMFSFEEDAIGPGATLKGERNGRDQLLGLATQASARVDPQTRCGAMLVYSDQLVIVPFRSESMELSFFEEDEDELEDGEHTGSTTADTDDEEDDEEEKKLEELVNESKNRGVTSDMNNTLNALLDKSVKVGTKRKRNHMSGLMANDITGREFLLRLRELEITGKVIDMAFLDGYLEPTLMVLHEENERNSTFGRLAVGFDTYCITVISINMNTRLHPKIWTVKNLPSDCFRLIPCRAPLGGVVVFSANAFLYFNQTQFHGLATNVFASKTVNQAVFPLGEAVYETPEHETVQLNTVLYDCQYEYLREKELLLTMSNGDVFVLSLPYEDTSNRGLYGFGSASSSRNASLSLRMLRSGVMSSCLCIDDEKKTLFVGSRSGDSVLYSLDQKKLMNDEEIPQDPQEDVVMKAEAVKEEAPVEVKDEPAEEEDDDEDDLFLYGAAPTKEEPTTSAGETTDANGANGSSVKKEESAPSVEEYSGPYDYELRQIDVLPSIGQITSIELGVENNADSNEKREELVISGGYERNGAISVLHSGLRPIVGTEAELNGCRAMWTVSSSLPSATKSSDDRSYNAYLILSVAQRTMVLRTGEGMEPLEDDSGFYTSGPTLAAANLFNKQRIVQIFKQGARVMIEVPEEETEANGNDKVEDAQPGDEEEDEGPKVKLVCTQEITLEGDVESGGMNVDTSSVGIVSVDVIDPYILLLLTDGSVRLLMGDEEDMELTVIDPEIDYLDGLTDTNGTADTTKRGSSSACLFYDWSGMFRENAWGEDDREERKEHQAEDIKKPANGDEDDDMDALYSTKASPRVTSSSRSSAPKSTSAQAAVTNADGSVSIPLLKQKDAKMMCGLCFDDGSLHVFSLPDFKKRGVFPYLTFAPQSLVNTLEHYQVSKNKRKAEFGATLHHMLYLGNHGPGGVSEALESPTYAVVCSIKMKPADAERATENEDVEEEQEPENLDANGQPIGSNVMAPTAEMFPDFEVEQMAHTEEEVFELRLVQTDEFGDWGRQGVFRVHFERYEVVLSIKLMYLYDSSLMKEEVASTSPEWNKKKRPYLVIGTGWVGPHGEDESGRGRLLLYELDYAQYVNEEGGATSRKLPKLRLVFIKEHRQGAISMVSQLGPYVLAAVGSKLIVYEFKSEQLIGCAFYDAQMFIVTLSVVRDFVLYGDVYKSVHFLRWNEKQRQLVLLAKDYEPLAVSATEFSVFEKKLALLAVDMDENLHVMQFAPQDIESRGGQRLLRTSDFHLGVQVASMFRKRVDAVGPPAPTANGANGRASAPPSFYVNILGNSEGGVNALIPVGERVFRRLFTLQNVMVNTLPQNCALNPREFRMLKTNAQQRCGRPDAWTKKKWKKSFLDAFVLFRFLQLDYVAQKELARCIGTTPEVVIHNLLEVQHATATFL